MSKTDDDATFRRKVLDSWGQDFKAFLLMEHYDCTSKLIVGKLEDPNYKPQSQLTCGLS